MLAHSPKWVATERFTIEARAPSNTTKDQFRPMMQTLLADRFQLAVHFESQQASVYALSLIKAGKLGPNLRPHSEGPPCPATGDMDSPLRNAGVFPPICEMYMFARGPDHARVWWGRRNITMASLAEMLPHAPFSGASAVDRPVVDETGLNGTFDFKIEYAPEPASPGADGTQPDPDGTTFPSALREQLGLKLTSAKGQAQILVIDHVEKLSEN
jgi:uncharacterized protein (TIGR03435 family)